MERDEMIEKMFDDLNMAFIKKLTRVGVDKKEVAKELVKMGYLKVPEGAVVLTKEELVKTMESGYVYDTTTGGKINIIEMAREIERKETAMEILNDIFSDVHRIEIGSNQYVLTEKDKKRIAKKFGVEVDE